MCPHLWTPLPQSGHYLGTKSLSAPMLSDVGSSLECCQHGSLKAPAGPGGHRNTIMMPWGMVDWDGWLDLMDISVHKVLADAGPQHRSPSASEVSWA